MREAGCAGMGRQRRPRAGHRPRGLRSSSGSGFTALGAFPVSVEYVFGFSLDRQDCVSVGNTSNSFHWFFSHSIPALTLVLRG